MKKLTLIGGLASLGAAAAVLSVPAAATPSAHDRLTTRYVHTGDTRSVPEPASLALLALGLGGLGLTRRRRSKDDRKG